MTFVHGAGLGERLVARDAPFDDADLLIELAGLLAHVGDVDGLKRRRDERQHVARLHGACRAWESRLPAATAGR